MFEGSPKSEDNQNQEIQEVQAETGPENPNSSESIEFRREEIVSEGRESRFKLLTESMLNSARELNDNPKFQKALDLLQIGPVVSALPVAFKMAINREGNRELKTREYVMYGAGITTEVIALGLMLSGHYKEAGAAHLAADFFIKPGAMLSMAKSVVEKVKEQGPKLAHMMEASLEWLETQPKEYTQALNGMLGDSFTTLNLDNNDYQTHG